MIIAGTGMTGLIGSRIKELLSGDFDFVSLAQQDMDITSAGAVETMLHKTNFDILLHLAGYTDVDRAETEKETVHKINVEGTQNIFAAVQNMGKKMIYISTDFVFDGRQDFYTEESTPNPLSYYGETKYQGEAIVHGNAMIVRISYPYRAQFQNKSDIVRNILELFKNGKSITGVTDNLFTPTFIDDIAAGLKYLMNNFAPEIYHLNGGESLSGYDLAITIADSFGLDKNLVGKTTFAEFYKDRARRPQKSVMKSTKNNFYKMKTVREALEEIKLQLGR